MDFLYGNLPEIVDNIEYTVKEAGNTIKLNIDNDKRQISAYVVRTPGELFIENGESEDNKFTFDGSIDRLLQIPEYKLIEVQPSNGDVRRQYTLNKYNFETKSYDIQVGDTIYFEEQLDELNIENGADTDDVDSSKISVGNGGITSVQYQVPRDLTNTIYAPTLFDVKSNEYTDSTDFIGQRPGDLVGGGTQTGIQSVAFGGNIYGISGLAVVKFKYNGKDYFYNIINERPLILRYASKNYNLTIDTSINDVVNQFNFSIIDDSGNITVVEDVTCFIMWDNQTGKVARIHTVGNGEASIIRGNQRNTNAKGNQSLSVGGGTQADADWSQAFGIGTSTSNQGQMVIGTFNKEEKDALFVIGNGHYDITTGQEVRSNALSIMRDGTIKLYNENSSDSIVTKGVLDKNIEETNQNIMDTKTSLSDAIDTLRQDTNEKFNANRDDFNDFKDQTESSHNELAQSVNQRFADLIMNDGYIG